MILMTMMAQNKVRIDGHYEVKTLEPITDYAWVPGEEFVEGWQADELLHPWRREDERYRLEEEQAPEQYYWLEIRAL